MVSNAENRRFLQFDVHADAKNDESRDAPATEKKDQSRDTSTTLLAPAFVDTDDSYTYTAPAPAPLASTEQTFKSGVGVNTTPIEQTPSGSSGKNQNDGPSPSFTSGIDSSAAQDVPKIVTEPTLTSNPIQQGSGEKSDLTGIDVPTTPVIVNVDASVTPVTMDQEEEPAAAEINPDVRQPGL